jgi:hypothetical protein
MQERETGMGYCVANAILKDGREFKQVLIDSGHVTAVKGHKEVPFKEADVDHFVVTHEKWDFTYLRTWQSHRVITRATE